MINIPIKGSSLIDDITYNESTKAMDIKFLNGKKFRYQAVEREDFEKLGAAESTGKHFHKHIKGKYETSEI